MLLFTDNECSWSRRIIGKTYPHALSNTRKMKDYVLVSRPVITLVLINTQMECYWDMPGYRDIVFLSWVGIEA